MRPLPRPFGIMNIAIKTRMSVMSETPVDLLWQFAAAVMPDQDVEVEECRIDGACAPAVAGQDGVGERVWAHCAGEAEVIYRAVVRLKRRAALVPALTLVPHSLLPGEEVPYLFESRYCASARFATFVESRFAGTTGGARVAAIADWVANEVAYESGVSSAETDAAATFIERRGVCRDFAHLVVAMARASDIPARYVSGYAPGVTPQDFHAVAEVYLADPGAPHAGQWHLIDATGMAGPQDFVRIGVGRDAADVSFLTSLGAISLAHKEVSVSLAQGPALLNRAA